MDKWDKWGRRSFVEDIAPATPDRLSSTNDLRPHLQFEHAARVVLEDRSLVPGGEVDLLHRLQGQLDVLLPAVHVERHVGGEQDAFDAEEVEAASQRRRRPERNGVGMEQAEVFVGIAGERERFVPACAAAASFSYPSRSRSAANGAKPPRWCVTIRMSGCRSNTPEKTSRIMADTVSYSQPMMRQVSNRLPGSDG